MIYAFDICFLFLLALKPCKINCYLLFCLGGIGYFCIYTCK